MKTATAKKTARVPVKPDMVNKAPKGFVALTFRVNAEDGQFGSYCDELGTASCGDTIEEAIANLHDAVLLHLATLDELGERAAFFRERGIRVRKGPLTGRRPLKLDVYPDTYTTCTSVPLVA